MAQQNIIDQVWCNGGARAVQRANFSVNVATTDGVSNLPVAAAGLRIFVLDAEIFAGATPAASVTFNSKGAGAGTAISPVIPQSANGITRIGSQFGLYVTNVGEGLTLTTGAGTTAAVGSIRYFYAP
jgi:hypothetical protein